MENFLQAVFSSSSVDASLANDAGMVLKLFEADRSSVRCVRAAMTALSKLQTGTATLVRFRNLCYIIFCYVFVLSIFVCGITLGTWNWNHDNSGMPLDLIITLVQLWWQLLWVWDSWLMQKLFLKVVLLISPRKRPSMLPSRVYPWSLMTLRMKQLLSMNGVLAVFSHIVLFHNCSVTYHILTMR